MASDKCAGFRGMSVAGLGLALPTIVSACALIAIASLAGRGLLVAEIKS